MSLSRSVLAALAVFLVCPLGASAQDGKKITGTITAMEAGDIACYLTLRDDAGVRFRELADFEICEQRSLLNKRVALAYKQGRVQSDECQGDPDCKKSRTVMLVVSARPLPAASGAPSAAPPPVAASKPAALSPGAVAGSHCTAGETAVFSCTTGAKAVSVCAAGGPQGYLQYRFGKLGEAPEMSQPEAKVAPARAAAGESVPFSGGGGVWLRFTRGAYGYVVYSGIGNWGRGGAKKEIDGVVVETNGKQTANVKCVGRSLGQLGPELLEKLGITAGKQDFDFPTED